MYVSLRFIDKFSTKRLPTASAFSYIPSATTQRTFSANALSVHRPSFVQQSFLFLPTIQACICDVHH